MRGFFSHWGKILCTSLVVLAIGPIAFHWVETFIHYCGVPDDVLEIVHDIGIALLLLDGIIILSSATIGAGKLLGKQVDDWK